MPVARVKQERVRVVLPTFRLVFDNFSIPRTKGFDNKDLAAPEYGGVGAIDINAMQPVDKQRWQLAIETGKKIKQAYFGAEEPDKYISPIYDGTKYNAGQVRKGKTEYPALEGMMCIKLKGGKEMPGFAGPDNLPIVGDLKGVIYAGCYCIADGFFWCYDNGSVGMNFYLMNVKKVADGEPLGRVNNPSKAFEGLEVVLPPGAIAPGNAALLRGGVSESDDMIGI